MVPTNSVDELLKNIHIKQMFNERMIVIYIFKHILVGLVDINLDLHLYTYPQLIFKNNQIFLIKRKGLQEECKNDSYSK